MCDPTNSKNKPVVGLEVLANEVRDGKQVQSSFLDGVANVADKVGIQRGVDVACEAEQRLAARPGPM